MAGEDAGRPERHGAVVYTGQSCPGGRGTGAWAALVAHGAGLRTLEGREPGATNDRLELLAALAGLRALAAAGAAGEALVVTRNQNLYQGLTTHLGRWRANGWRTRAGRPIGNTDLWQELHALTAARPVGCRLARDYDGPDLTGRAQELAAETAHKAGRSRRSPAA